MSKKEYLALQLRPDLREEIAYHSHSVPFSFGIDYFDDYRNNQWPAHWHDEYEFVVALRGCVTFTVYGGNQNSTDITLTEGDGLFIAAARLHSAKAMPGTVAAGYVFSNTFFNMKPFETVLQKTLAPVTNADITYIRLERANSSAIPVLQALEELRGLPEEETGYELHRVEQVFRLWRMLLQLVRSNDAEISRREAENSREQRLKDLVSYIYAHYSEPISVEAMARYAGVSRTECFRCFQSILGKTPIEYLTEHRLSVAATLLLNTRRPIADIAEACGFQSPGYFGKLFREVYGKTPKEYRKNGSQ